MRKISKQTPPSVLLLYQGDPNSDYRSIRSDHKNIIKKSLIHEQGYLCAYCMCRIDESNSTIEHWVAQNSTMGLLDSSLELSYNNMFAVCMGNRGNNFSDQTCDAHRGNNQLTVSPIKHSTIDLIKYRSDGYIYSDDQKINNDLNQTLNLNCEKAYLPQNRKAAMDEINKKIFSECNRGKNKSTVCRNILNSLKNNEKLITYFGTIEWKLNKYI